MPNKRRRCAEADCNRFAYRNQSRCNVCRNLRYKLRNPIKYAFIKLRYRAKERGHEFTITIFDYACLWFGHYGSEKGKSSESLSLDRIDNSKGYVCGNLRVTTLAFNSRRQWVPYFQNLKRSPTNDEIAEVERQLAQQLADPLECL